MSKKETSDPLCAHADCGWRLSAHFGTPPQFCKMKLDGSGVDTRQTFKKR